MKQTLLTIPILLSSILIVFGQALPVGLDGKFDDWTNEASSYTDTQNDGAAFDLLSFKVANDSNYLFIQIVVDKEIQLNYGNNLYLEIDTDNNPATGYQVNGIGAELGINFGTKTFYFNTTSGTTEISPYDIGFIALPTVTSDTFEIAIDRNAVPDGTNQLFTSNTIKICFKDDNTGGDYMPDEGTTFSYTFDNSSVGNYNFINLEKNNENDIRLMTYNTLYDGLISGDNERVSAFQRIITAVNPDIITFNECWNTTQYQAQNLLNSWLPLQGNNWTCVKNDAGNITCSKFPVTDYYTIDPTYINRVTANIIDLPDLYPKDFLVINSHFKCCSDDDTRQKQADAIIEFIKDVKNSGGSITLPYGTPFVISGDLNLVGLSQQLTTLLTGDIVDNYNFGDDIKPDWDNTDLTDIIAFHTDKRIAVTIRDENSSYWPGRIDYAIASDIGATVSKTFIIDTEEMSADRLNQFGLQTNDTKIASDHLPKITDFIIDDIQNISKINDIKIDLYPNPSFNKEFMLSCPDEQKLGNITVVNVTGQVVYTKYTTENKIKINLSSFPSGIYFVKIKSSGKNILLKLILV